MRPRSYVKKQDAGCYLEFGETEAEEEDDAAEGEFGSHGDPDTLETERGGEDGGKRDANKPNGGEVHDGRDERLARADEDAVGDDGGGEERFRPRLDAKASDRERLHGGVGCHE